jgi:hypothetical protein
MVVARIATCDVCSAPPTAWKGIDSVKKYAGNAAVDDESGEHDRPAGPQEPECGPTQEQPSQG